MRRIECTPKAHTHFGGVPHYKQGLHISFEYYINNTQWRKIVPNSTKSVLLWLLKIFIFINICSVSSLNRILTLGATAYSIYHLKNLITFYRIIPKHNFNTSLVLLDVHLIKIIPMIITIAIIILHLIVSLHFS